MATIVLLTCVGLVLWMFVLYPLLLLAVGRLRGTLRPPHGSQSLPSITVLTVIRGSADETEAKIRDTLALDYPTRPLEILVCLDGPDPSAGSLEKRYEAIGVRVLAAQEHRGKIAAMNDGIRTARGDVVVFTDAAVTLEPDAVRHLVRPLADPIVGGVAGALDYVRERRVLTAGQRDHMRFVRSLRDLENRVGSVTSNSGALYCVRRALLEPLPPAVTDDLYASMTVVRKGYRFAYEPRARALMPARSRSVAHEIARRRRIVTRSLRGLWLMRALLDPTRYGLYAVGLFTNKVLRRLLPVLLLGLLGSGLVLSHGTPVFLLLLGCLCAAGTACMWVAIAEGAAAGLPGLSRVASAICYVAAGSLGTLLGLSDFVRGRSVDRWEPQRAS